MSRTRKDGVRGGGHRNTQHREVWSRRCRGVAMWARDTFGWKRITHRFERREAKRALEAGDPGDAAITQAWAPFLALPDDC